MLLLMICKPNIHQKLRNEIYEKLSDHAATISDKVHLDYVMAFLFETLRYRNAVPIGVFHRAIKPTIIGTIV